MAIVSTIFLYNALFFAIAATRNVRFEAPSPVSSLFSNTCFLIHDKGSSGVGLDLVTMPNVSLVNTSGCG
jgi:hypothetical protein